MTATTRDLGSTMDDLFYFTKAAVTLGDVAALARSAGFSSSGFALPGGNVLSIIFGAHDHDHWEWLELREETGDLDGFEPENRDRIGTYGPVSSFQIAHHAISWPMLRVFLKQVLQRYGGWIGCDTDDLEPIYDHENIDRVPYPLYVQALELVHAGTA